MLVHKWEHADGTIVEVRSGPRDATGQPAEHNYVIDARRANGELVRGRVAVKSVFAHQVGQVVRVEVHSKTNEIKLHPHTRAHAVSDSTSTVDRRPSLIGDLTPGAPAAPGGFGSATRQPADLTSELVELRQAMRSGDPAARQGRP